MFAPKAIFECDKKFDRIINVRSNIGYDHSNEPFFPNHECTAPVNFQLDLEDCNNINELRFTMSCLLKVERAEKVPELSDADKKEFTQKAKDLMMKILQRDRVAVPPPKNPEGFVADPRQNKVILKLQNRAFAFNQIEFPKLVEKY